jgi:lipopolysaccharide export system permease protein
VSGSQLIGITFEQVKFVTSDSLSLTIAAYVHLLKLPAFISVGLPLSLLMATMITYSQLSARNEIIALQSYGVSLFRLLIPVLFLGLLVTGIMFIFHELIVPTANYQAAMILEKEWNVDRTELAKYNKQEIIYQQFATDKNKLNLEFIFFADRFDGKKIQGITLLKYHNHRLQKIITARTAQWNEQKQLWQLFSGRQNIINSDGYYAKTAKFLELKLKLTKNIFDYANHHRDHREMNIIELSKRLEIIKNTDDIKTIRSLEISIQERYALAFSCLVFTWLRSSVGMTAKNNQYNSFALSAIAIFAYYSIQFLSTSLCVAGILSVFWGVWLPNLLGLVLGSYYLKIA